MASKRSLLPLVAGVALLAGCGQPAETDPALAGANASGNAASDVVENRADATVAEPIAREEAIALMEARHENYERIGDAMKGITRELRADAPDAAEIREQAALIASLAPEVRTWFPAGTGPDVGKTEARAAIWENPQDFAAKVQAFERQAQAFNAAAQSGDVAAIRTAHGDLGKSCKACHDLYREEH